MAEDFLVVYDYCNLGGVTSIFKHRIADLRQRGVASRFTFLFRQDLGGAADLLALPGVQVEIHVAGDFRARAAEAINASTDTAILVDQPEIATLLAGSGRRVLYEVHTSLEQTFRRMRHADFSGVEKILCVSNWLKRKLGEAMPAVTTDKVAVNYNFVDDAVFCRSNGELAVPLDGPPVLWIGKISADKNWEDGLDILRRLRAEVHCVPLLVTGGAADQATVMSFLHRVDALGLASDLRWITNLSHREMPGLLNGVRNAGGILLSTSKFESFGLAVLEAMSCGLPSVAAAAGGLSEIMSGLDELQFALGDNRRAADIALQFLTDRDRHKAASASVLARSRWFDRERIMSEYLAHLTARPEAAPLARLAEIATV